MPMRPEEQRVTTMETTADKWWMDCRPNVRRPMWTIGWNPAATEGAYKRRSISRKRRTHISVVERLTGPAGSVYNNFSYTPRIDVIDRDTVAKQTSSSSGLRNPSTQFTHISIFPYLYEPRNDKTRVFAEPECKAFPADTVYLQRSIYNIYSLYSCFVAVWRQRAGLD